MTSTITPPPASSAPRPLAPEDLAQHGQPAGRLVRICADLLPEEVIAARRMGRLKHRITVGLAALALLLAAGYVGCWRQTAAADDRLAGLQQQSEQLFAQQAAYTPLVEAQAKVAAVSTQLAGVMTDDLDWSALMGGLTRATPSGVTLTNVTGALLDPSQGGAPTTDLAGILGRAGAQPVGTVTVTGTAPSKAAVAAFVDSLARVHGLAAAYPSSVSGNTGVGGGHGGYTFSVSAQLTTDVLSHRYDTTPTPTGGH